MPKWKQNRDAMQSAGMEFIQGDSKNELLYTSTGYYYEKMQIHSDWYYILQLEVYEQIV